MFLLGWTWELLIGGLGTKKKTPQNMAPWHIIYFKLKESEKTTETGRSI